MWHGRAEAWALEENFLEATLPLCILSGERLLPLTGSQAAGILGPGFLPA